MRMTIDDAICNNCVLTLFSYQIVIYRGEITMIICMNIGTDGTRYVAHIEYDIGIANNETQLMERAKVISEYFPYDEVYAMGFDCNCIEFINEVVLRGCRV